MDHPLHSSDSENSATTDDDNQQLLRKKAGVKIGTKRGKYKRSCGEKKRVIDAALNNDNWKEVAAANCVPLKTAYGWLKRYREGEAPKRRGGTRNIKVTQAHIDTMLQYVEKNPLITLVEIKQNLMRDTGISIFMYNDDP